MDAVEKNGHGVQEMKLINPTERMEVLASLSPATHAASATSV
jgi:hypothetical protein